MYVCNSFIVPSICVKASTKTFLALEGWIAIYLLFLVIIFNFFAGFGMLKTVILGLPS